MPTKLDDDALLKIYDDIMVAGFLDGYKTAPNVRLVALRAIRDAAIKETAGEIERLREEVQTNFDAGYRAAGGEIIPLGKWYSYKG